MKKENIYEVLGWAYFYVSVIAVVFMAYLKLTGDLDVTWWVVTSPLWVSLIGAFALIGVAYVLIWKFVKDHEKEI